MLYSFLGCENGVYDSGLILEEENSLGMRKVVF